MKKRYADIVGWFEENMPLPKPELHFDNAWQLLVAAMLSSSIQACTSLGSSPAEYTATVQTFWSRAVIFSSMYSVSGSSSYTLEMLGKVQVWSRWRSWFMDESNSTSS